MNATKIPKKNQQSIPQVDLYSFTPDELLKKGYTLQQLKAEGFSNFLLKEYQKNRSKRKRLNSNE